MNHPTMTIDGVGPMPIHRPANSTELGELVRRAAAEGQALYPLGGGTQLHLGNPPAKPGLVIDMRGLDGVLDYPARDMTITVQPGISVSRLQETLAGEKQRLPIDVPRSPEATLGGIIAANVSGARRLGYGTLRDYVIGISAINDEGQEFKGGGRVVKNVAGYDMCKLLVGSLGTLGIISQVTLKLRPVPETSQFVLLPVSGAALEDALDVVHRSRTRPAAVELLENREGSGLEGMSPGKEDWVLAVGYEGSAEAVRWQVNQLREESRGKGEAQALEEGASQQLWSRLAEGPGLGTCVFKATLLPSALAAFCREQKGPLLLKAHAASGIVWGHGGPGLTLREASPILSKWRQHAEKGQGKVIVARCPSDWKGSLDVWGPEPEGAWLMKEIKRRLDPREIFNPGRFVGGI